MVPVAQATVWRTEFGMAKSGKPLRKRDPMDHYPSPLALCRAAVGLVGTLAQPATPRVLDPGAGTGPWGRAARERWGHHATITGVELDKKHRSNPIYDQWVQDDFLSWHSDPIYSLVIGNPPYVLAEEFVRKSAALLAPGGRILFLLRLGFLASQGRGRGLFKTYPPTTVYVCATRPSFLGETSRKTDATEYALFSWQGREGETTDRKSEIVFWDWSPLPACVTVTQDQMAL